MRNMLSSPEYYLGKLLFWEYYPQSYFFFNWVNQLLSIYFVKPYKIMKLAAIELGKGQHACFVTVFLKIVVFTMVNTFSAQYLSK